MKLSKSDEKIVGAWANINGKIIENEQCEQIKHLTKNYLIRLANDYSGWDVLYYDPYDNRLWELIYPHSELAGGGPPLLRVISLEQARDKYSFDLNEFERPSDYNK